MNTITKLLALAALTATPALAQLDPPPGPVAPTFKTLDEVQPRVPLSDTNTPGNADARFIITEPGSYYLTANMLDVQTDVGILIAASDVTIDLMGFTVSGSEGAQHGIRVNGTSDNLTIRNGTVTGFTQAGVDLAYGNANGLGSLIEHVRSNKNGFIGIYAGVGATIRGCQTLENGGSGFIVFDRGTLESCESRLNGGNGFVLQGAGTLTTCTADQNEYVGIRTNGTTTINACSATNNGKDGILTALNATVTNSNASDNQESGFVLGAGSTITNSSARANSEHGIQVAAGSAVSGCTAFSNGVHGVSAYTATVTDSTAHTNGDDGFSIGIGGSISGCNAADNAGDGIQLSGRTTALNNTCNRNGYNGDGAGIHVSVNGFCRVEGNNLSENDIGIQVESHSNFIIKNVLGINDIQFDISGGNSVGEIVHAPTTGAIYGNGVGASPGIGTQDPWANFIE